MDLDASEKSPTAIAAPLISFNQSRKRRPARPEWLWAHKACDTDIRQKARGLRAGVSMRVRVRPPGVFDLALALSLLALVRDAASISTGIAFSRALSETVRHLQEGGVQERYASVYQYAEYESMSNGGQCSQLLTPGSYTEPSEERCLQIAQDRGVTFYTRLTGSTEMSGCVEVASPTGGGPSVVYWVRGQRVITTENGTVVSTQSATLGCVAMAICHCVHVDAVSPPPPPRSTPWSPPPPPVAPPSPGAPASDPCVYGDATSVSDTCAVTIRSDEPCTSSEFMGRTCLTINKPFHVAFVGGSCYDNTHRVVQSGCFELAWLATLRLSYFPSQFGAVLSAALNGDEDFSTHLWNAVGPLDTDSGSYAVVLKAGHQFVIDSTPTATQIFETPFSQYTHGLLASPPPSPPPSPSPPPPL